MPGAGPRGPRTPYHGVWSPTVMLKSPSPSQDSDVSKAGRCSGPWGDPKGLLWGGLGCEEWRSDPGRRGSSTCASLHRRESWDSQLGQLVPTHTALHLFRPLSSLGEERPAYGHPGAQWEREEPWKADRETRPFYGGAKWAPSPGAHALGRASSSNQTQTTRKEVGRDAPETLPSDAPGVWGPSPPNTNSPPSPWPHTGHTTLTTYTTTPPPLLMCAGVLKQRGDMSSVPMTAKERS